MTRMRLLVALVLAFLCAGTAAAPQFCTDAAEAAFVGADVLTMRGAAPEWQRGRTVVVRNGRIAAIGAAPPPAGACVISATGKVLLPGLADMHAHLTAADLPLFLANGVTLVREMNGSPEHLALRAQLERGAVTGPRLLVTTPLLAGVPQRYRHQLLASPADADTAAKAAADAGYDFLKVYDGLSAETYAALVTAGARYGLRLDGHVPQAVGLERVIAAGQAIQHMDKIAFALAGHTPDSSRLQEATRLFSGRSSWVTPTLASLRALDAAGTSEYAAALARPELAFVDPELVSWWRSLERGGTRTYTPSAYYRFQTALLRTLAASGVRLLVGTDASNPLMVHGSSVHDELAALVRDSGLTTWQALLAATRNAAEFMGDSTGGRIAIGARADLLLVDGDPLADLSTLRRPHGVMVGGRWYDRPALDAIVARVRK